MMMKDKLVVSTDLFIYTNLCFDSALKVLLMALKYQLRAFVLRPSISQERLESGSVLVDLVALNSFPGMSIVQCMCTRAVCCSKVVDNSAKDCGSESEPRIKELVPWYSGRRRMG